MRWNARVYGLGRNEHHHYPAYAPKVVLHTVRHWAIGPLLGCSCSRCFHSRWRLVWSREFIHDRVVERRRWDRLNEERRKEGKPVIL